MSDQERRESSAKPKAPGAKKQERESRSARALRENLKRRKAQLKAREAADKSP